MIKKMKICVFPNDPILSYYEKGEIKEKYFNPNNFFDEVHIISFIEKDIEESKVQNLVGNASLIIHSVGKINLKNKNKHIERIIDLVKTINPNVIRSYNPSLQGWFAAKCAEKLEIPFFVSLHTQYDYKRGEMKRSNFKKFLALKYSEKFLEKFVLKQADKITIVYKIIEPYVLNHGGEKPELLYNKVDCKKFIESEKMKNLPSPLILSVGNLIVEKNHEIIIKAMKKLNSNLLIIGKGPNNQNLNELIKNEKLENKITIIESVPHKDISKYYKSADVFALAYNTELEGLPIPVMEAMASGLPVVIPYPKEGFSEGLEDICLLTENNSESFANNIEKILSNEDISKQYSKKSLEKAQEFDVSQVEKREAEIYQILTSKQNDL
jgi:glycosyltransferase involved in cell wall biosynthesis